MGVCVSMCAYTQYMMMKMHFTITKRAFLVSEDLWLDLTMSKRFFEGGDLVSRSVLELGLG